MYSATVTYGMGVLIRVRVRVSKIFNFDNIILNIGAFYMGFDHIL